MRVSIPATLLMTLSAHHYLSHALPLNRSLSVAPRALDYPVVNVADPDVEGPGSAPGDDEDDDENDDMVTRTITRESGAPTGTRTLEGAATATEDCITSDIVPIVGVKETGAVRSTTTYTTRSSPKTPVVAPTPAPSPSPNRPVGTAKTTVSTSEASGSEPTPAPSAGSVSSPDVPAHSRNGTSPIITSSPTIGGPSEESSSSTTGSAWSPPGVIVDTEHEAEWEPTPSSATWSAAPTPVSSGGDDVWDNNAGDDYSGDDYSGDDHAGDDHAGNDHAGVDHAGNDNAGDDYDGGDYDGDDHAGGDYAGGDYDEKDYGESEYAGDAYTDDAYGGDADAIPTSTSSIPVPLWTGDSEASYDVYSDNGSPSWNRTTPYDSRHSI